jgi:hypothetical protein
MAVNLIHLIRFQVDGGISSSKRNEMSRAKGHKNCAAFSEGGTA